MCVLRSHGHGVHDDHRPVVGHEGRQLQPIAGAVRAEDQGHGSVFVQCIRVVSHVDGVCQSVSYVVVADPMAASGRFDLQVGFRHQGIVPRNSYERPSSSRAGTTQYDPVQVGTRPLELEVGRTASRVGHPQHGLRHRLPGPTGSARIHRGVDDLHSEALLFPTSDQRLDGCDHLVPAGERCWLASPQVDGPTGDRWAWLAFRGTTTTRVPYSISVTVKTPSKGGRYCLWLSRPPFTSRRSNTAALRAHGIVGRDEDIERG